ncbi:hypothetical protein ACRBEV_10190 [Methylobacterium phyllosphaerae]
MRITRDPALVNFSQLEPGSCFLFASEGPVELGLVAKMSDGQQIFVVPGPRDPDANNLPQIYPDHFLMHEEVLHLQEAEIHFNTDVDSISCNLNVNLDYPAALYKAQDGLYLRAVYRRANVFWINVITGLVERKPLGIMFCFNHWDVRWPNSDGSFQTVQEYTKGRAAK